MNIELGLLRARAVASAPAASEQLAEREHGPGYGEDQAEELEDVHVNPFRVPAAYVLQTIVITAENHKRWGNTPQAQPNCLCNQMPPKKSAANVALGAAARSIRAERGLAQEALALLADMDRSYYGAIERGEFNVSLDTIVKIADALGVSASVLLGRADL